MPAAPVLYVAGDVHLRDGGGPFPTWLDGLRGLPPARLVILGDLFEYWLDGDDACLRYAPVLERLRRLRALGWRSDLVLGNREQVAGRRLAMATGCALHWPRLDLALGPLRLRIIHGDRLCHDPGYRMLAAWLRAFPHRWWQISHPAAMQEGIARWLRQRSLARQRHQRRGGRRPFLDPRRVAAAARGVDAVIAGHIHEAWRRRIRGVDLSLVGDWPGTTGHWIEGYADGTLVARSSRFA